MKKLYPLKYGLLVYMLLSSLFAFSQTGKISGEVRDDANLPLPGASVLLKGSVTRNSITDQNGAFVFNGLPQGNYTVSVSLIGYETYQKSLSVKEDISLNIQMETSTTSLQQVVVVGYGTQRRQDVTGAVTTVNSEDLNQGPITNPLQQLTGKAAGVNINQIGSEPGSAPNVRIRGISSLIGGNDPLVVIDGVQGNMDLLNQIPPTEIESFDILKDASATAIYGSRGAPGVIIITTKKSKTGATTIEYNAVSSVDAIAKKLDILDANQWWQQAQLYGVPASANHGSNTDWYGILTKNGTTQNHTLSLGGGEKSFSYRAALNLTAQDGIVLRSNFKNYNGRIQATQKTINDKLSISLNLNSSVRETQGSPGSVGRAAFTSNLVSNAYISRPTDPVFNTDGSYYTDPAVFQYINPYAVSQTVVNEGSNNNTFGSLKADLEVAEGLILGAFGSWRRVDNNWGYYMPAASTITGAIDNKGIANINNNRQEEKLFNASLNFKRAFGDHSIDALGLYEWQRQVYNGNFVQAKGFINDIAAYHALQLGDLSKVQPGDFSSYKNDRALISFLARVNYSYQNKYLLTASIRRDGSTVFGTNHKWGNFPSASIAWRIDQEDFMRNQTIFNVLKLRAGFGITGNQQGLYPQSSLQLVGYAGQTYFGGSQITNYAISQNGNEDLRWETKNQTNVGLDFAVLNSKLSGTIDAYTATTKNLLFNYTVPRPPYPFGNIVANVGSMLNKGLEVSLNYKLIDNNNTTLTLGGNGSWLQNEVLNLSGQINGVPLNTDYVGWGSNSYLVKGKPIGSFYVLEHAGKDANNKELVVDRDESGTIDQGARSLDRYYAGGALPTYTYAFTPSFRYKNFDAAMVWRGSGGNKIYNNLRRSLSLFENIGKSNLLESAIPIGLFTTEYSSDLWLEDGSFLRFENITLGYRFDVDKIKHVSSLRLSLTGNNLAIITNYSGLDPELNLAGGNGFGADGGIYPRLRSVAIGLNIVLK